MVVKNAKVYAIAIILIAMAYILSKELNTEFHEKLMRIESELKQPFYIGEYDNKFYIGEYSENKLSLFEYETNYDELVSKYESEMELFSIWGGTSKAGVLLMESFFNNDKLNFQIKLLKDGNDFQMIFKDECVKIPSLYLTDDNLFINFEKNIEGIHNSLLVQYDLNQNIAKEVDKRQYTMNNDGTCEGRTIIYSGGHDDLLYYQLIHMDNETIERAEKTELIKFSLYKNRIVEKYPLKNKVLHVNGTSDFIILSEYDYFKPVYNSGKIYSVVEDRLIEVGYFENVESGRDIMNSRIKGEGVIMFTTADSYNVYDFNKGVHLYERCSINQGKHSDIKILNNKFSYMEKNSMGLTIHIIEYKN